MDEASISSRGPHHILPLTMSNNVWNSGTVWSSAPSNPMFWTNNWNMPTPTAHTNICFSHHRFSCVPNTGEHVIYDNSVRCNLLPFLAPPLLFPQDERNFHFEGVPTTGNSGYSITLEEKSRSGVHIFNCNSTNREKIKQSLFPAVGETPSALTQSPHSTNSEKKRKIRYRCRFCDKPFCWFSHWQAHERIHTGERPFKCNTCHKAFTRSDGLKCHQVTHLPKKDALSHAKGIISPENAFENRECFQRSKSSFSASQRKRSPKCFICGIRFLSLAGLERHIQEHKKEGTCQKNI